jgi:peptidoglycan/xylan/chitin deacetylase (PgdA/CDA1 family)
MARRGDVAILTYHSLDDSGAVLSTPPRIFAAQMQLLHERGIRVIPLSEVCQALSGQAGTEPLLALTFDDGFRNVYEYGLPVLQRYGFPATVFLVTDYCGALNAWPGQPASVERRPLLSWAEVREMSVAGIAFGSHTRTHPDLRRMTRQEIEEELVGSKQAIEDTIGRAVDALAYPYGAANQMVRHLAQTHFALACSTTLGSVRLGSDPFALERIDMYYLRRLRLFRRLFLRDLNAYLYVRRLGRSLRPSTR